MEKLIYELFNKSEEVYRDYHLTIQLYLINRSVLKVLWLKSEARRYRSLKLMFKRHLNIKTIRGNQIL